MPCALPGGDQGVVDERLKLLLGVILGTFPGSGGTGQRASPRSRTP